MSDDIPIGTKRSIIENELAMWRNTCYQAQLRYRVQKAINGSPELLKQLEGDMVNYEHAIDLLKAELAALA